MSNIQMDMKRKPRVVRCIFPCGVPDEFFCRLEAKHRSQHGKPRRQGVAGKRGSSEPALSELSSTSNATPKVTRSSTIFFSLTPWVSASSVYIVLRFLKACKAFSWLRTPAFRTLTGFRVEAHPHYAPTTRRSLWQTWTFGYGVTGGLVKYWWKWIASSFLRVRGIVSGTRSFNKRGARRKTQSAVV